MADETLRNHLARLLDWEDAHTTFDAAVTGIPPELQGRQPAGLPYSPWQLVEHIRIAQRDILDFCSNADYEAPAWPDDYWPATVAPPAPEAWERSVEAFRTDCDALKQLAADEQIDLLDRIPHGTGQTYLRELLLIADHTSYHLGQLVAVRRLLGAWPPA
jgi:uncharacterized damage-inducible protein DinB